MIATALTEMFGRAHLNRATGSTELLAQYLKAILDAANDGGRGLIASVALVLLVCFGGGQTGYSSGGHARSNRVFGDRGLSSIKMSRHGSRRSSRCR